MKLSDAIRLGAMLHPQCFDRMEVRGFLTDGKVVATCALGAAIQAGYRLEYVGATSLVPCPVPQCHGFLDTSHMVNLYAMVTHLNDWHRWTREAIAGWVETIEGAEEKTTTTHDDQGTRARRDPTTQVPQPCTGDR